MLRAGWSHVPSIARSRSFTLYVVKGFCFLSCIDEYLIDFRPSEGTSMLPTLSNAHDQIVNIRLPFYRLLSSSLPDYIRSWKLAKDLDLSGIPNLKGDPSMGTGIKVGDLVAARSPLDPTRDVCKRVMGLPGDTILLDPRVEPPTLHDQQWTRGMSRSLSNSVDPLQEPVYITVPKGHVWLVGDNLGNSLDSRHYGPIPLGLVKGKVVARMFPSFKWLPNAFHSIPQ
jgi:inner membrane protease subunit 1